MSSDLVDWFDHEIWRQTGTSEYDRPVTPDELLADAPDAIWPGLMPCDLLPIIGDSIGNWLCVRIGENNRMGETIQWYHGGGDWMPWGQRLSDAIVFEALVDRLPGPRRQLAIPAEIPKQNFAPLDDPLVRWAFEQQTPTVSHLLTTDAPCDSIADTLLSSHVAEVAVRCELVQSSLHQRWSDSVDSKFAQSIGFDWNDVVQWRFDDARMPNDAWRVIARQLGLSDEDRGHQDWDAAAEHGKQCIEQSPDLLWPWDIAGYAEERRGRVADAMDVYREGAYRSTFTDQAVRINTHWTQSQAVKFCVARMQQLEPEQVFYSSYLKSLVGNNIQRSQNDVYQYWIDQSKQTVEDAERLTLLMRAGWDLGAASMDHYANLLEAIFDAATNAGQHARAALAKAHRQCLRERYEV
ncbi:hypothetical protein [Novipirellula artificiosorum]|uniref:hypothetical protein n=1 Tax=Novipirellula artificiosorum TaxID=2528016 RepID=UPI0011B84906|nr:hypothetical protein [Novipirellula artificiosorum]